MARPREQLPRLNIAPSLNAQQPVGGPGMYSPALPTAIQQSFHPPFPVPNAMPPFYNVNGSPQPPAHRPTHHPGSASVAHLAAAGIHPPNGFPMPSAPGHFPRPSLMLGPGQVPHFQHRRRQPSIGGPPKAVLGGPARKLSPIPPGLSVSPALAPKSKKAPINLPKETVLLEGETIPTRPSWARTPIPTRPGEGEPEVEPVEIDTREVYPPEAWVHMIPDVVDVFLPSRVAWEEMKQQSIEEKLKKLGVERGSGSNVPQIFAPHARAASISSPADPNLLLFKLNQLQRSREGSATNSLAASPQPPFTMPSPSIMSTPGFSLPRHAHTMSLAHLPSHNHRSPFEEGASTNPFGHDAVLGNDHQQPTSPYLLEKVPSVAIKTNFSAMTPPPPLSAIQPPESRPDFTRGFGLDIPEEEEPEEEEERKDEDSDSENPGIEIEIDEDVDKTHHSYSQHTSPFHSRHHSKHTSKVSAHLSLGSFGGSDLAPSILHKKSVNGSEDMHLENEESQIVTDDVDAVREWTGTDSSDDEVSIGEWSNPSDEERARRERVERRLRRRAAKLNLDKPRRIPNFPRPPENTSRLGPLGRGADVLSNPSEENLILDPQAPYLGVDPGFFSPVRSQALPHSRSGSAPYSAHDPAQAHSRTPSDEFVYPGAHHHQQSSLNKHDLNPFAKPFVFGTALASSSPVTAPSDSPASHTRVSSFNNRPLNVAAPEFKPGGFTFRPPPGVPQMPVPHLASPVFPTSLPPPPRDKDESSPHRQGREKRQRRGSLDSEEGADNSMLSFKFPRDADSPRATDMMPHPYPASHGGHSRSRSNGMDPATEPFTFAGFSAVARLPVVPSVPPEDDVDFGNGHGVTPQEESTLRNEATVKGADEGTYALTASAKKRPPIPLDFKGTMSPRNTVPAGLFKALANEDRTRKAVRSRLDSRDLFDHFRRPSMDDNDVPQISRKSSHVRLGGSKDIRGSMSDVDIGTSHHSHRRSSLPDNLDDIDTSSEDSVPPMNLTSRMEMHRIEHVVGEMLEEKFSELRREIARSGSRNAQALNPSTEAQIADVISLFRTQLQESATRSLEDTQMDARGEMDFQLIKDVVEEGQKQLLNLVRNELKDIMAVGAGAGSVPMENGAYGMDARSTVEAVGNRVITAVRESIMDLAHRQEAISHAIPARERDALAEKLVGVLTPILASLRTEPLDYDFLTSQLTQAVKPHITQLIDLASDKRETASIIVESILPLLPPNQPTLDTDALTLQLISEVRRAIAPIDAFEIREQVADLVVERLDSRLAVRDKAFNVETIAIKVNEVVSQLLESLQTTPGRLETLAEVQNGFKAEQEVLGVSVKQISDVVGDLPAKFEGSLDGVLAGQKDVVAKLEEVLSTNGNGRDYPEIKVLVEALAEKQKDVIDRNNEALTVNKDILAKVQSLPEIVNSATSGLQTALIDLIHSRDEANRDIEELRRSNTDYQLQLAKARGAHGQVRVEKDMLNERLGEMEVERERLRAQVEKLEQSAKSQIPEKSALQARNVELEEALSQALLRLQTADVTSQSNTERIAELQSSNAELSSVKSTFEAKVLTLETQLQLASHERESATRALDLMRKQHDELQAQQSHWEDLRQASEKIDILTNLVGQADNEELLELRRYREQSQMLEADHNNLQRRFKELENRLGASEKSAATTKQNLVQAQQKVSEWERRAKESEALVEALQTKLDQAEQSHAQLDADHSLVNLQLEEREVEYRAMKDRETRSRDTITALENKIRTMQVEFEKRANLTVPERTRTPSYRSSATNGYSNGPARPDSRTSTVHVDRSATPTRRMSGLTASSVTGTTPPQPSVWDSMHAPRGPVKHPSLSTVHAPAGRYPSNLGRGTPKTTQSYRSSLTPVRQPSPAMSVVSNAPTLGEDGWWE